MGAGGLHRLLGERRGGRRQRREDPSGVQAPHSEAAEQHLPIDVTGGEHAGRAVTAVGDADCSSHAKAAFGEVQPVARPAPDTVERDPAHEAGIDATLQYQVLDQPPHVVVTQRGDDRGAQPEAAA